ncbi:MAG: DnaJ domain-containing protein [Chitinophagaceae bacterium]|nr:DnaJ domain-containing protein [Chitinophagaceae bacterium]
MNYFTLFEIPVSLKVNASEILKKYYVLSRQHHPDNYTLASDAEQEESEKMTTRINQAKLILENPTKRLAYILQEKGLISDDEKQQLSPQFLGEMMDINEQLMELEFEPDVEIMNKVKDEINHIERKIYAEVELYFLQDELKLTDGDGVKLKEYYFKQKYIQRIKEKLI